jgi:hypothetical protein
MTISIAKDFSRDLGARYPREADYSGEEFRQRILYPKFCEARSRGEKLEVNLDGTYGIGSGFLDEAFAGLILNNKISYDDIKRYLVVTTKEDPMCIREVEGYLEEAREHQRRGHGQSI